MSIARYHIYIIILILSNIIADLSQKLRYIRTIVNFPKKPIWLLDVVLINRMFKKIIL